MAKSCGADARERWAPAVEPRARIREDCLELDVADPTECAVLRTWMSLVNGAAHPQPFLEEREPGRFRLHVGPAAERVRTAKGVA